MILELRNIIGPILGSLLSISSILTYIPQFHIICKEKSVKGISELSLLIMNIGLMCLTMNSIIFNWSGFTCDNPKCFLKLFPFVQITISWVMVLIFYIIFLVFKKPKESIRSGLIKFISTWFLFIIYIIFILFVVSLCIGEKFLNSHSEKFFYIFANVLGYSSAVCNGFVWLPQIFTLYVNKNNGKLSIIMFALQTPGNLVIIFFQSVIYLQPISTWITYVITLIEQSIILFLMIKYRHNIENVEIIDEYEIESSEFVKMIN